MNVQTQTTLTVTLAHNQVRATKHLISTGGYFIPKGSTGRVVDYTSDGGLIVDFGYHPVFSVPPASPLIQFVNGGAK